jgi:tripartite-type tricarboxylate transporter receptor subunit TctC
MFGSWNTPVQAAYPERPITVLVGSAPGGGNDVLAHMLSVPLGRELGVSIVIENKPEASGAIAAAAAAKAQPDGYTLLLVGSTFTIIPALPPLSRTTQRQTPAP